jgi:hypothetical protein
MRLSPTWVANDPENKVPEVDIQAFTAMPPSFLPPPRIVTKSGMAPERSTKRQV